MAEERNEHQKELRRRPTDYRLCLWPTDRQTGEQTEEQTETPFYWRADKDSQTDTHNG